MTKLTQEERLTALRILRLLDKFRSLDSEMQMPQAVTLLTIALNEGITLSDLKDRTDQGMSSASRNVAALSTHHRVGKPGHGLVINREDPLERRKKQHMLTPKGRKFVTELLEVGAA